jgi:CBS domain-containing protein
MKVRDLTTKAPVTLPADATIEAAARLMDLHAVGAVVIVDGERPVGVVRTGTSSCGGSPDGCRSTAASTA